MGIIGVTGSMGCGKTYVCKRLEECASAIGIGLSYVGVDDVRRDILGNNPKYAAVRSELSDLLGADLMTPGSSIDRNALGEKIFNDAGSMQAFRDCVNPVINEYLHDISDNQYSYNQYSYSQHSYSQHSDNQYTLVEWALLVEDGLVQMVDYDILLIACNPAIQLKRLAGGDLPMDQIESRIAYQLSNDEKEYRILGLQEEAGYGRLTKFDTTHNPSQDDYISLLESLLKYNYMDKKCTKITK